VLFVLQQLALLVPLTKRDSSDIFTTNFHIKKDYKGGTKGHDERTEMPKMTAQIDKIHRPLGLAIKTEVAREKERVAPWRKPTLARGAKACAVANKAVEIMVTVFIFRNYNTVETITGVN
jgi:hypothetical protein